jgi:hypothetical protein
VSPLRFHLSAAAVFVAGVVAPCVLLSRRVQDVRVT